MSVIDVILRSIEIRWFQAFDDTEAEECTQVRLPQGRPVLVKRHRTNAPVFLSVVPPFDPPANLRIQGIKLIQHHSGKQSVPKTESSTIPFTVSPDGLTARFNMTEILTALATFVNQNLIEAHVTLNADSLPGPQTVIARNLLHLITQHAIFFLPGVCGSILRTQPKQPADPVDSFPAWSIQLLPGLDTKFQRLNCVATGDPATGSEISSSDLLETFSKVTVYTVANKLIDIRTHPLLRRKDGTLLLHYKVIVWHYDWRLRLEIAVDRLLGKTPPGNNNGATRPPLEVLFAGLDRKQLPYLADKFAVSGHSTGGVILRGLLARPGTENIISKAFFMNTPFLGAPKAYFVYLTGDFLPFIGNPLLQSMAPNLPIVYYLAPTERYPKSDPVAKGLGGVPIFRRAGQDVGAEIIDPLKAAMSSAVYPAGLPPWNKFLEKCSRDYHQAASVEPSIKWDNCRVFVSQLASPKTPGPVRAPIQNFNKALQIPTHEVIDGDGTVPIASLRGDSPASRQFIISAGPVHDQAANDDQVWEEVANDLTQVR